VWTVSRAALPVARAALGPGRKSGKGTTDSVDVVPELMGYRMFMPFPPGLWKLGNSSWGNGTRCL
jgi:hypothetical protein